jgi:hypothetical protein
MIPTIDAKPLPAVPQDVLAFAAEKGVTELLPRLFGLVRSIFPMKAVSVLLEEDAEIDDFEHIVFEVDTSGLDVETLVAAQQAWSAGKVEVRNPRQAAYFLLGMR